jgi:hypothetical protein
VLRSFDASHRYLTLTLPIFLMELLFHRNARELTYHLEQFQIHRFTYAEHSCECLHVPFNYWVTMPQRNSYRFGTMIIAVSRVAPISVPVSSDNSSYLQDYSELLGYCSKPHKSSVCICSGSHPDSMWEPRRTRGPHGILDCFSEKDPGHCNLCPRHCHRSVYHPIK